MEALHDEDLPTLGDDTASEGGAVVTFGRFQGELGDTLGFGRIVDNPPLKVAARGLASNGGGEPVPLLQGLEVSCRNVPRDRDEGAPPLAEEIGREDLEGLAGVPEGEGPVKGSEDPAIGLVEPLPHGPENAHKKTLHVARGEVDNELSRFPPRHGLQSLADLRDMPIPNEWTARLDNVPRELDEGLQGGAPAAGV